PKLVSVEAFGAEDTSTSASKPTQTLAAQNVALSAFVGASGDGVGAHQAASSGPPSLGFANRILFLPASPCSRSPSHPMNRLPSTLQATPVVPAPAKGSQISCPGSVRASRRFIMPLKDWPH